MTDAPPIITNEDAAIDSAFFGSHAGRTCYARAHLSGLLIERCPSVRRAKVDARDKSGRSIRLDHRHC